MNQHLKEQLVANGYVVVKGVLNDDEVAQGRQLFFDWFNRNDIDSRSASHGIYKYHNVGHTKFAWMTRVNANVKQVFGDFWETNDLIVSFDGCCYIKPGCRRNYNWWMHTDQNPNRSEFECLQGFVSYTDNQSTTLRLIPGSHWNHFLLKETGYGDVRGDWCKISEDPIYGESVNITVNRGDLVLWDSRLLHQNVIGGDEERLVQYVCYIPRQFSTGRQLEKRRQYFSERRTTSHWPHRVKVNSLQPQTFGDETKLINYSNLIDDNLGDIESQINLLI